MPLSRFIKKLVQSRKVDMKKGKITVFGIPGVLLPVDTWVNLGEKLEERMGDEAYEVMFLIGKDQGKQSVEEVGSKNKMGQREFIEKMIGLANIMGVGEMKVVDSDPNTSITLSVKESPFLREKNKETEHLGLAEFLKGTSQGIGEGILGDSAETEVKSVSYSNPNKIVFKTYVKQ